MSPAQRPSLSVRPRLGVASFARWWCDALASLVPAALVQWFQRDPLELVLHVDAVTGRTLMQDRAGLRPVDRDDLRRLARWYGPLMSATLMVPEQRALVRAISLPRSAAGETDSLLRVDLARTTPFRPEEVLSSWYSVTREAGSLHTVVHHIVVKRSVVARAMDELAAARIPLKHVRVAGSFGGELPVDLLTANERQRASATRLIGGATCVVAGGLVVASLAWAGFQFVETSNALAEAEIETAATQAEFLATRARLTDADRSAALIKRVRLRRLETQTALDIWEEVSRLLPNGTWVSEFRIEEGQLQIDGFSSNAAELPATLAKSNRLADVRFVAPVTRDAQRNAERFQIRLRMAPAGADSISRGGQSP